MNRWRLKGWASKTGIQITVLLGMHSGKSIFSHFIRLSKNILLGSLGMNSMNNRPNTDKDRQNTIKPGCVSCSNDGLKAFLDDETTVIQSTRVLMTEIMKHAFVTKKKHPFALPQIYLLGLSPCLATIEAEIERYNGHSLN